MGTTERTDEWLWGWDETPGIVSVWAEPDGRANVWRRDPGTLVLTREEARFRPWLLLASLADLEHLGARLRPESAGPEPRTLTYEELEGEGALRFLIRGEDAHAISDCVVRGASRRLGRPLRHVRELGEREVLALPPEEQYLVASGRTHFRGLSFDQLQRTQLDLETTGLDPECDRVFLVALRGPTGEAETLEAKSADDSGEIRSCGDSPRRVAELDPDVIENHNLHGFDLPFLARRAEKLGLPFGLGRVGAERLRKRPAARGVSAARGEGERAAMRRMRYTVPGRELIDTMDAVRRHDFASRDLPGHGLKAVARYLGLSTSDRELIPGAKVHDTYLRDPERVRRYAKADVVEAAGLARLLGGAAFALAKMVPRRYERLADAGPATGVLDPLLVRAYLRTKAALPAHATGDGTPHQGAALHLFATGVAQNVVKADVASLYPSLMRQYRIGPKGDRLEALVTLVGQLVDLRLAAKAKARAAAPGSPERHTQESLSLAMKLVVNSAYGYMGAVGLTRFSDVHAANRVTHHGREVLALMCRELAKRNVTLLEADTDGVYFAMPRSSENDTSAKEARERAIVAEVAALLPERVKLEFDGRYAAMLSHEPKNYALLPYDGALVLRGVAFRSSRAEPFGEAFLRRAITGLLRGDVREARAAFVDTVLALRRRELTTHSMSIKARLTKTWAHYLASRETKRELVYEALLGAGRTQWSVGERVRVYRRAGGAAGLLESSEDDETFTDPRDYDVDYYTRLLERTFATRLARALTPEDYAAVVADPMQGALFPRALEHARPILTELGGLDQPT